MYVIQIDRFIFFFLLQSFLLFIFCIIKSLDKTNFQQISTNLHLNSSRFCISRNLKSLVKKNNKFKKFISDVIFSVFYLSEPLNA